MRNYYAMSIYDVFVIDNRVINNTEIRCYFQVLTGKGLIVKHIIKNSEFFKTYSRKSEKERDKLQTRRGLNKMVITFIYLVWP
jgi:hypothetical protein